MNHHFNFSIERDSNNQIKHIFLAQVSFPKVISGIQGRGIIWHNVCDTQIWLNIRCIYGCQSPWSISSTWLWSYFKWKFWNICVVVYQMACNNANKSTKGIYNRSGSGKTRPSNLLCQTHATDTVFGILWKSFHQNYGVLPSISKIFFFSLKKIKDCVYNSITKEQFEF